MREKKPPRILVEWECSECDHVHRISFPYVVKSLLCGIRVKWGKKDNIKKLELDYGTPISKLNDFLNFTFSERLHAINYVKINYPESLSKLLEKNEQFYKLKIS